MTTSGDNYEGSEKYLYEILPQTSQCYEAVVNCDVQFKLEVFRLYIFLCPHFPTAIFAVGKCGHKIYSKKETNKLLIRINSYSENTQILYLRVGCRVSGRASALAAERITRKTKSLSPP